MSKTTEELLSEIKSAHEANASAIKERITALEKGQATGDIEQKLENTHNALEKLEAQVLEQQKAADAEIAKLKKGTGWKAEQENELAEKRRSILNDFFRKGMLGQEHCEFKPEKLAEKADTDLFKTKDMSSGVSQDGGFFVMPEMANSIQLLEKERTPVRSIATVMSGTAASFEQPVQTKRLGASRVGEKAARPSTDSGELQLQTVTAFELYANPQITQTLLDDSSFDLIGYVNSQLADEFSITEGYEFVHGAGSGSNEFRGILKAPDGTGFGQIQQVETANSGEVVYEDLVDIDELLLPAFGNGASWLMNRTSRATLRKIVDLEGRPLLQPDLPNGGLPTVFGKPIVDVPDMPNIAADSLSIAYGDFRRGYMVYDRMGIRILRDPYTNKPYIGLYTTKRSGGEIWNHQAFKLLKTKA